MTATRARPALQILKGRTVHSRFVPFARRFDYSIRMIEIDIGRLREADRASALFGVNRKGLFAFDPEGHGDREGGDPAAWARARFNEVGLKAEDVSTVRICTFPRHLFYRFAPITLWLGETVSGELSGVIYEVNNTFGETHSYVSKLCPEERVHEHGSDKVFHVSPFFGVDGQYRFRLSRDEKRLNLVVENLVDGVLTHTATIAGEYTSATTAAFAKWAALSPLSSLGVTFAIHWQALKIWARGGRYHRKPEPPAHIATVAKGIAKEQENSRKNVA